MRFKHPSIVQQSCLSDYPPFLSSSHLFPPGSGPPPHKPWCTIPTSSCNSVFWDTSSFVHDKEMSPKPGCLLISTGQCCTKRGKCSRKEVGLFLEGRTDQACSYELQGSGQIYVLRSFSGKIKELAFRRSQLRQTPGSLTEMSTARQM